VRRTRRRKLVVLGLFVAVLAVATVALASVIGVAFFGVTVAYVLYPVRRRLVERGLSQRVAAGLSTALGFLTVVLVFVPIGAVIYVRRASVIDFVRELPRTIPVSAFGFEYVVEVTPLIRAAQEITADLAVGVAAAAPVIALKLVLFAFVVYGLLSRPHDLRKAVFNGVPETYHDILTALHERVRDTLYAIYVLQAATAAGTFLVALVVFFGLGYESAFSLAVIAGLLQFIPVVGPSVLVLALAGYQVVIGDVTAAILVATLGLVFVGFLPDAVIRPKLADYTADMPGTLYFVGFVGGVLSLGLIGFVAGPLVVAVLVEVFDIASEELNHRGAPDSTE
jgi:predicted PurR-regulated permease PerM